ncbi:MAG: tetratricopeptide repeat protein [Marinilabiliaceae bacterium]|nr:tetratricopeptide repeat protein [Marinilabiliaceae bacterium]
MKVVFHLFLLYFLLVRWKTPNDYTAHCKCFTNGLFRLKKGIVLLIVFVGFIVTSYADTEQQQEFLTRLNGANVNEKIVIYNQLSRSYLYSDPQKTITYAQKALKLAVEKGNKRGEAEAYSNLGLGYYFKSDFEKLLKSYKKSIEVYKDIGDEQSISALSSTYYRLKQSEQALNNYFQSLQIYIDQGKYNKQIETCRNIGDVYRDISDYGSAIDYYLQSLSLLKDRIRYYPNSKIFTDELTQVLSNIGKVYFNQGEYRQSLMYFNQLTEILADSEDLHSKAAVLNNVAGSYFFMNELDSSFYNYTEALKIQSKANDYYGAAMSLLNIGRIYLAKEEPDSAKKSFNKSLNLAKVVDARDLIRLNYYQLSELYKKEEDYKRAYEYQSQFSELTETIVLEENVSQFINTLAIHDLEQKNVENQMLKANNENYKLKLERISLIRWRVVFILIIIIVLILTFFAYYRYYIKREENRNLEERIREELKKQEAQHQIIVHQASLTSLGEMAAGIAHEVNQPMQNISLSAEGVRLELNEDNPDKEYLKQSIDEIFEDIERVREIVDHIRIFSSGQKDMVVEEFDVSECVRAAVSMIGKQYSNHHIDLQLELSDHLPSVLGNPHKLEQVIFNLLSNARDAVEEMKQRTPIIKKKIDVVTFSQGRKVVLEVIDNGVGIPLEKQTDIFLPFVTSKQLGKGTGLGLSISHRLVKEMGGRIEVESKENEGTLMRIILPNSKYN